MRPHAAPRDSLKAPRDELVAALARWNQSRQQWELAKSQLADARASDVPALAMALLKVQVDTLDAQTYALFEEAMVFMDRRPLGPGRR